MRDEGAWQAPTGRPGQLPPEGSIVSNPGSSAAEEEEANLKRLLLETGLQLASGG